MLSTRLTAIGSMAALAGALGAQAAPVNDASNPYRAVAGWAKMPDGRAWGSTSAVAVDKDGVSVWVAERCGQNDCVGSRLDPVLKFDANGNLVKHFGAGMIRSPHGIHVDRDGNVWVVDCACTGAGGGARGGRARVGRGGADPAGGRAVPAAPQAPLATGHQIFKFSPDGELLMTLGKAGGDTAIGSYFFQPNNVATAPNGDIWVVEGHGDGQDTSPARVLRFDRAGKLTGEWGTYADTTRRDDPFSFMQPHAVALDSRGLLYVGDRSYNRIKVFDPANGMKLLATWHQFSRPSGIYIDAHDTIYVADSESGSVSPSHWAWKRGIRIGSVRDGKVAAFIPDPMPTCYARIQAAGAPPSAGSAEQPCAGNTWAAEGVAVDRNGVIYGAEVGPKALMRYVRQP